MAYKSSTYNQPTTEAVTVRKPDDSDALILRPPGAFLSTEQPPADPYAPEVQQAITSHGDQPRTAEIMVEPGVTATAGLRNLYLNFGGLVAVIPLQWHTPENFER